MKNTKELWDHYYLVGSAGGGVPVGVLLAQPGTAGEAIPELLQCARDFTYHRPYSFIYGIYVGQTGRDGWMQWHSTGCEYGDHENNKLWIRSGAEVWHPRVSTVEQPKVKGWPRSLQRLVAPRSATSCEKAWGVTHDLQYDGTSRYIQALKSMTAIREAVSQDESFLSAFRHGSVT